MGGERSHHCAIPAPHERQRKQIFTKYTFHNVENASVNKFLRNIRFTDVEKRQRKQVLTEYAFHRRRENAAVNKILRNIRFTDVEKRQR